MTTSTVHSQLVPTKSTDKVIGVLTLNRGAQLNSLDLDMVRTLSSQLQQWQDDEQVVAVVIQGDSHRAFCAGGDLHALYQSMRDHNSQQDPWGNTYGRDFFAEEYRLDHVIHCYPKPIVALGFGILMGGGVGVFAGASHRVVAPQTRYAMPEIVIGLFPDVAGSWILSRLPAGIGHTLAMTGANINGADVYYLGLADYLYDEGTQSQSIVDALVDADWGLCPYAACSAALTQFHQPSLAKLGQLVPHYERLRNLGTQPDFAHLCQQFADWGQDDSAKAVNDPWLKKAGQQFIAGSPMSIRLSYELLRLNRHRSLAQAFQTDFNVAMQCLVHGDFQEGIRALIIDKDRQPQWQHEHVLAPTQQEVQAFLRPAQPKDSLHPLHDLAN